MDIWNSEYKDLRRSVNASRSWEEASVDEIVWKDRLVGDKLRETMEPSHVEP